MTIPERINRLASTSAKILAMVNRSRGETSDSDLNEAVLEELGKMQRDIDAITLYIEAHP